MTELFANYAALVAALPEHTPLTREDVLCEEFLLARHARFELYWAPFEYVNSAARLALVGIAPGWYQTEQAFRVARDELQAGTPAAQASALARRAASFSGPIRRTLVAMLDGLDLHNALGIGSCWELWGEHHELLHTTALVRYPVFIGGKNWSGYTPDALKTPLLRQYVVETLADELRRAPQALIVPLGRSAAQGLALLAEQGALDPARLLPGLPHPSGANVHRPAQYAAVRQQAAQAVQAWFGGLAGAKHLLPA
ncbi:MAG: hypothetical protein H7Z42_15815 [Roseiflexaceae bacterium]|nr:hypothetical protein [Roseiflexaceae bacterium]